jgi:hypothetical protein
MQISDRSVTRRQFVVGSSLLIGAAALPLRAQETATLSEPTRDALAKSRLVYLCPLHPDGTESQCHGEVWFFVDDGDLVLGTDRKRWKTRAVEKGWDKARIWVGDFGPVKKAGNKYRDAPQFDAQASIDADPVTFEKLKASFGEKYADEWSKWGPRFQKSYDDGTRVLIRYRPISEGEAKL